MDTRYEISLTPPSGWYDMTRPDKNLFYSKEWHELLQSSFNVQTFYILDKEGQNTFNLSVFTKWPFRIAYINFPVGLSSEHPSFDTDLLLKLKKINIAQVLKVPVSGTCSSKPKYANRHRHTVETIIRNLNKWDPEDLKNTVKRNIRKSNKSPLMQFTVDDPLYATRMHDLYKATIKRAGGGSRYTVSYFRNLVDSSSRNPLLRITGMKSQEGELEAFLVIARHENTSFYLHGAMNQEYTQDRPMYSLFYNAIVNARHDGDFSFNMMSSPPKQSGLIRFKEQWNATTLDHYVYDYFLSNIFGHIYESFLFLEKIIKRN